MVAGISVVGTQRESELSEKWVRLVRQVGVF